MSAAIGMADKYMQQQSGTAATQYIVVFCYSLILNHQGHISSESKLKVRFLFGGLAVKNHKASTNAFRIR